MIEFLQVVSMQDVSEVARLAREIWQEHYVRIIGQEQVTYMLEKFQSERAVAHQIADNYEYYIITYCGHSAGYLALVPEVDESKTMISKIYVKKSLRGRGLGKMTINFIEGLCRQRGIGTIWLTVNKNNTSSIAWYQRMGFENVGVTVQDIGGGFIMDDFKLEKELT